MSKHVSSNYPAVEAELLGPTIDIVIDGTTRRFTLPDSSHIRVSIVGAGEPYTHVVVQSYEDAIGANPETATREE